MMNETQVWTSESESLGTVHSNLTISQSVVKILKTQNPGNIEDLRNVRLSRPLDPGEIFEHRATGTQKNLGLQNPSNMVFQKLWPRNKGSLRTQGSWRSRSREHQAMVIYEPRN